MKVQKINPNNINPMQMNNMNNMMGMMNMIQKIGKGKRKIAINLDKNNKKFLSKFIDEIKKQFLPSLGGHGKGLIEFFEYIKSVVDSKNKTELKLTFEEFEFLKKTINDTIKGMENFQLKWYQLIKKMMFKVMLRQYKDILTKFK